MPKSQYTFEGYGHQLMFGPGGIFTEVFKDSRFTLAPIRLTESEALTRKNRSSKCLKVYLAKRA